jgi:hypothetical protein
MENAWILMALIATLSGVTQERKQVYAIHFRTQ